MIKKTIGYITIIFIKIMSFLSNHFFGIISYLIYILIYKIIKYRVTTVRINLMTAFSDKSSYELKQIEKQFYKYFADLIVQNLQSYSFNEHQVKKYIWLHHDAKQLIWALEKNNQPIFIVTSHFGNWELSVFLAAMETRFKTYGIYQKLSNQTIDRFVKKNRAKFGIELIETKLIKNIFKNLDNNNSMFCFVADQTPVAVNKATWINFFGVETPFYNGYAHLAQKINAVILYASIEPINNTHFEIKLKEITKNAANESIENIVDGFAKNLEQDIKKQPAYWLWTHRRWKRADIIYYDK